MRSGGVFFKQIQVGNLFCISCSKSPSLCYEMIGKRLQTNRAGQYNLGFLLSSNHSPLPSKIDGQHEQFLRILQTEGIKENEACFIFAEAAQSACRLNTDLCSKRTLNEARGYEGYLCCQNMDCLHCPFIHNTLLL